MSGFIKDEPSLANGIPARHISPETGAFGNATETNRGGTSEGVNESDDSMPPPAAGLDADISPAPSGESRSFGGSTSDAEGVIANDDSAETAAQKIADGGDRRDSDTRRD